MKKKVSIWEVLASKIIIAILVAIYYWWCSRSDFNLELHNFVNGWITLLVFLLALHYYRVQKYKKEYFDELAEKTLQRCDAICLKVFVVVMVVAAFFGGMYGRIYPAISTVVMGWVIIGIVIAITILRTIMFLIMDSKGA